MIIWINVVAVLKLAGWLHLILLLLELCWTVKQLKDLGVSLTEDMPIDLNTEWLNAASVQQLQFVLIMGMGMNCSLQAILQAALFRSGCDDPQALATESVIKGFIYVPPGSKVFYSNI